MAVTTSTEDNKRIVRRFPEDVATEGDIDLIDELCAEDIVDHNAFGESRGREEVKKTIEEIRAAFSDFSATVEDIVAEGDTVAMRVTLRGTHDGTFQGMEPTGESFEVQNMVFTRLEDGKIAERWVLPDRLGMLQQLGAIESPAE